MHDTRVEMKDGRVFHGPIWEFRPKEGYLTLTSDDPDMPERLHFKDMKSAVTKDQRMTVTNIGDCDELQRAREQGWVEEKSDE